MLSEAVQGSRWLSVQDVADELEVSAWTVRKMIERGELPATKIGPKPIIKISAARFEDWLEQNT